MEHLRIQLLGTLHLTRSAQPVEGFPTRRCRSLFSYLAVHHKRRHARDVLAGVFWGELPDAVARKRLRTNLWRIRAVVEPAGVPKGAVLDADAHDVGLLTGELIWLDVDEFVERLQRIPPPGEPLAPSDLTSLERAIDIYQGELLEGNYDDWCIYERERLKAMFHQALYRLIAHRAAREEWDEAIVRSQDLLGRDPLQEQAHRGLMRFYYMSGNRPAAMEQFRALERLLDHALGVEPMLETRKLFAAISEDDRGAVETASDGWARSQEARSSVRSVPSSPLDVIDELTMASRELERTGDRLRQSIAQLERRSASSR